jgi:hypothetical protein
LPVLSVYSEIMQHQAEKNPIEEHLVAIRFFVRFIAGRVLHGIPAPLSLSGEDVTHLGFKLPPGSKELENMNVSGVILLDSVD